MDENVSVVNNMSPHGYTINDDLTVDVEGGVMIDKFEGEIPVKFNVVKGIFNINANYQIKSTDNFPVKVNMVFCNADVNLEKPDWCECEHWYNNRFIDNMKIGK